MRVLRDKVGYTRKHLERLRTVVYLWMEGRYMRGKGAGWANNNGLGSLISKVRFHQLLQVQSAAFRFSPFVK